MNNICHRCPILSSCQAKYLKPNKCLHRPAPIGINISEGIANMGRKRIVLVNRDYDLSKVARDEHVIRLGMCEGAWD